MPFDTLVYLLSGWSTPLAVSFCLSVYQAHVESHDDSGLDEIRFFFLICLFYFIYHLDLSFVFAMQISCFCSVLSLFGTISVSRGLLATLSNAVVFIRRL